MELESAIKFYVCIILEELYNNFTTFGTVFFL